MPIVLGEFYNNLDEDNSEYEDILESAMSSKERNELSDDEFGIPSERKYPLNDKNHVEQAIKMFNHVDKKHESELADNLLDAMEKYRISTDSVGENNRLRKYIKEETVYEGLIWNDKTPDDIKQLKKNIKEGIKTKLSLKELINVFKDNSKNVDFKEGEKKITYEVLKKNGVTVHGYTIKTSTYGSVQITNTHTLIGTYKNYIITAIFAGSRGKLGLTNIVVNYDKNNSEIPKDDAFGFISMLSPNVTKVRCTKRSIKIFALSKTIDSEYPRVDHKYSKKYGVKKIAGMWIKLSTLKTIKEDSLIAAALPRQDYQPNSVYVINYLKNNTFDDMAICKDKMTSIFICDDNESKPISLSEFKQLASHIRVYEYIGTKDCDFDKIIKESHTGLDFYKNIIGESNVNVGDIHSDWRFNRVPSYIDELNSLEECILNSAPKSGVVNEVYCPIIPLVNLNEDGSSVHYFRDIDGVFAQNIDTLARSASYKSVEEIPETTINLLKNI